MKVVGRATVIKAVGSAVTRVKAVGMELGGGDSALVGDARWPVVLTVQM